MSLNGVKESLFTNNQRHLLRFWKDLSDEEQETLISQLETINFKEVNNVFLSAQSYIHEGIQKLDDHMRPIPPHKFEAELEVDAEILEKYNLEGLKQISKGGVAVILLAGGQGSRMGVTYPKGMFPLDLPSGKTLFQIQAERIRRIEKVAEETTGKTGKICWFIMTSQATHDSTEHYLEKHKYFGLNKGDVVLFRQGVLPCFTFDGKIILDEKHLVSLAPDGNGGIYKALRKNNILEIMRERGIKYVHVHSIDNILVKVADPSFIGYCVKKGADCGAKVIPKETPNEALGVVCEVNGKFQVVEYSEITDKTASLRDEDGNLVFRAGSICNHFFTTDFLEKASTLYEKELKPHVAKKKIPYVDESGKRIQPTVPNGIKIEKFIFDVFEFSENFVTWEVPRNSEFSPLKNCESIHKDCPSSCRRDLFQLHKHYVKQAGGDVLCDEFEISPLLSYAGENLEDRVKGKVFNVQTVLFSDEESASNGLNGFKHCKILSTKIKGGETAELGEYPWMALLGYQQIQINYIEYLCGGTLITETFVLTAAHCLRVSRNHKLVNVRLGEHDLNSQPDCHYIHGRYICADDPLDVPVHDYVIHEEYNTHNLKNDIALIRLAKAVTFTDYILPICLPFNRNLENRDITGQKLTISGWGKTSSRNLGGSPLLQFASVYVWEHQMCNRVVPPEVQPIIYSQICANGKNKEDACKGDSGGPLTNSTIDIDGELRNFQIGIVSFASTMTCGVEELPPIYTRVDRYLQWILNIIEGI